jgi:hypothetical protein
MAANKPTDDERQQWGTPTPRWAEKVDAELDALREIVDQLRTVKRDWLPTGITILVNIVIMAYAYGKIEQRVTNLEQLRIEARAEIAAQVGQVQGQIQAVAADVRRLLERGSK